MHARKALGRAWHSGLAHGSFENVEESAGSYSGVGCAKHAVHGAHCVQVRSLPASMMAGKARGGVPTTDRLMWYAPAPFSASASRRPWREEAETVLVVVAAPSAAARYEKSARRRASRRAAAE